MFRVNDEDRKELGMKKSQQDKLLLWGFILRPDADWGLLPLSKFAYPSGKRPTAYSTEKKREAERCLDLFWQGVDEGYLEETGNSVVYAFGPYLQPRPLERTEPWVDLPVSMKSEETDVEERFAIVDLAQRASRPEIRSSRTKVKTRSIQPDTPPVAQPQPPHNLTVVPTTTIEINKRTEKVFAALFYDPTQDAPGEVPWSEFLYAFASLGLGSRSNTVQLGCFSIRNNASADHLPRTPSTHQNPHLSLAHRYGARLSRRYGWTRDTFIVSQ
jgi:hypothetical protein